MKTIAITLVFCFACSMAWNGYSQKGDTIKVAKLNPSRSDKSEKKQARVAADSTAQDSTEYELIVLDPEFDSYLATQPAMNFYSEQYYKNWNRQYVTEWNNRYMTQNRSGLYETYIDYDPQTEYGIDIEYRLYYYFRFFEKKNHITLIQRGR